MPEPPDDGPAASADAANTTIGAASSNANAASPGTAAAIPDEPPAQQQPPMAAKAGEKQTQRRGLTSVTGGLLTGLASQAAILTALLVYFGWVRTNATYGYFGIDVSALRVSCGSAMPAAPI